jgi:hypothetical protein
MKVRGVSANGLGHEDRIASIIVSTSSSESTVSASGAGVADGAEARAFFGIRSLLADSVAFCISGEPDESVSKTVRYQVLGSNFDIKLTYFVVVLWISFGMQLIVHRTVVIALRQLSWHP